MKKILRVSAAIILAVFGLITLFLSTSVFLDLFDVRAKEGNYVLHVVWANFFSSILYLFAAYGFLKTKKWTPHLLYLSTITLIAAFIGLLIYIQTGGIYEQKTIGAMLFRILFTLVFAIIAYYMVARFKSVFHKPNLRNKQINITKS